MSHPDRRWTYFAALGVIVTAWAVVLTVRGEWADVFGQWEYALTMAFGSFVAGSTPAGGGAVAFPVLTKVLDDPPEKAKAFSLMIQSVGMSMATVLILSRRIKLIPLVILWVSIGGALGQILGVIAPLPPMTARLLFTAIAAVFGVALAINRWALKAKTDHSFEVSDIGRVLVMLIVGLVGGYIASAVGSDINLLTFIVLTLAYGVDEKFAIPTAVVIMAINAVFWVVLHLGLAGIGATPILDDPSLWHAWLAAVPIVAMGAPLGSWFASVVKRDLLVAFLFLLILVEVVSSLVILGPRFQSQDWLFIVGSVAVSVVWFWAMHRYRNKTRPQDFVS